MRDETTLVGGGELPAESRRSVNANHRKLMEDIHAAYLGFTNPYDLCAPPSHDRRLLFTVVTFTSQASPSCPAAQQRQSRQQSERSQHQHGKPQKETGRMEQVHASPLRTSIR